MCASGALCGEGWKALGWYSATPWGFPDKAFLPLFHCAFCSALQGVIEFSLCLLFAKLVSYTFLYWLPLYIFNVGKDQGKEEGSMMGEEARRGRRTIPGYRGESPLNLS